MKQCGWVLFGAVLVACGGKAQSSSDATGTAGKAEASGGAGTAGASGAEARGGAASVGAAGAGSAGAAICPEGAGAEPAEGAACARAGLSCPGYGSLSCPLTAVCSADLKWQITCPASMAFGQCSCEHRIGGPTPPVNHRATRAPVCLHTRAVGLSTPMGCLSMNPDECIRWECSEDSDCVKGSNGRCVQFGPIAGLTCSYDTCFLDSDCDPGSVCQCREPLGGLKPNYCTAPSNCQVDADCGADGFCSPSQAHEWCNTTYACHTPADQCTNDSDCADGTNCDFDTSAKHWVCANLCGPPPL